jgi:membrane protein YdbS with pleckstrin-like domain
MKDEETLLVARPSRVIFLSHYVAAAAVGLLGVALLMRRIELPTLDVLGASPSLVAGGLLALLALLLVLAAELKRQVQKYSVTEWRVMRRDGLLRRRVQHMPYTKVERIEISQSVLQRMVGIGDVVIDTGEDRITFAAVRRPRLVETTIAERVAERSQV